MHRNLNLEDLDSQLSKSYKAQEDDLLSARCCHGDHYREANWSLNLSESGLFSNPALYFHGF
ncbi:MAG: hypothetical protein DHS20C12_14040 [Pseudohongiella sp.]|nr:MAG: hypothetical protein DHS20C12_14040 [Pseudohongiella sp.]